MTTMFSHDKQFTLKEIEAPQVFDVPSYYSQIDEADKRQSLNFLDLKACISLSYPKDSDKDVVKAIKTRKLAFRVNPKDNLDGWTKLAPVSYGPHREKHADIYACLL